MRGGKFFSMLCGVALSVALASQVFAQQWATKMLFEGRDHDFGTVARGADVVYKFPIKNLYRQDVRLTAVRSSCGCTAASIEGKLLKTHETGYIVAKFNTRTFKGVHGATLTVSMKSTDGKGRACTGEAQVRVSGDIRSDVVFQPGLVRFAPVDQGTKAEQRLRITYAGRNNWRVVDVKSRCEDLEVELIQLGRRAGRVEYDLLVRLKDSAPAGTLREQLVLVTSDGSNQRIPVIVEGKIVPEISVSPDRVALSEVALGNEVTKRIVVRGRKPFRITDVKCDDDCFTFSVPDKSSKMHVVELKFAAHKEVGHVERTISIETDLGPHYRAFCKVYATVILSVIPAADAKQPVAETSSATASPASGNAKLAADL